MSPFDREAWKRGLHELEPAAREALAQVAAAKERPSELDQDRIAAAAPRFAAVAVHSTYLGQVFRVLDRERGKYVQTMPRQFVARASAEACAENLNAGELD